MTKGDQKVEKLCDAIYVWPIRAVPDGLVYIGSDRHHANVDTYGHVSQPYSAIGKKLSHEFKSLLATKIGPTSSVKYVIVISLESMYYKIIKTEFLV